MAELITMSQKEVSRYEIVQRLIRKEIKGPRGVIHRSRGRTSNRRIDSPIIEKTKYWLKNRYFDFQPTFASEKLDEEQDICLS